MYDLEKLMDIVPPLRCDYSEMDPSSAYYLEKLDHAIDMAVGAEKGYVSFEAASQAIYEWTTVSKTFFENPPSEVAIKDIGTYVEIHNRLLSAAMAAATAHDFEWPPLDN
jgi:hypothetical protein